jgi:chemotaxis signal transduction protein
VVESMRPLAITAVAHLAGVPAHVTGMSAVRGTALVVVDLASLLGQPTVEATRLVIVRAGERRIGLLVGGVLGIVAFPAHALERLPPLIGAAEASVTTDIVSRDVDLVFVLETSLIVPDDVFSALPRELAA